MNKIDALQLIAKAKRLHNSEFQKVMLMVKKVPLDGEPVSASYLECSFDQLLREEEDALSKLVGPSVLEEIESLHRQWHEEYARIDALYQKERGVVSKLFRKQPKLSELEQEKAVNYSNDLKALTRKILQKLDTVEGRLKLLHD